MRHKLPARTVEQSIEVIYADPAKDLTR